MEGYFIPIADFASWSANFEKIAKIAEIQTSVREIFDKKGAANYLDISVKKLEYLIKAGEITCSMDTGNTYIKKEYLLDYVDRHVVDKKAITMLLAERANKRKPKCLI